MNIPVLLKKLIARKDLTEAEAFEAVTGILSGGFTEGQIGGFLAALAAKGETVDEIAAGARAMRAAATFSARICAGSRSAVPPASPRRSSRSPRPA